jgi:hypothetical protein
VSRDRRSPYRCLCRTGDRWPRILRPLLARRLVAPTRKNGLGRAGVHPRRYAASQSGASAPEANPQARCNRSLQSAKSRPKKNPPKRKSGDLSPLFLKPQKATALPNFSRRSLQFVPVPFAQRRSRFIR